jgi:hypothetical protein
VKKIVWTLGDARLEQGEVGNRLFVLVVQCADISNPCNV